MNDKSKLAERRSWYMYDFAVSAFTTTVITVFLGPYLTTIAKNAADAEGFWIFSEFRFIMVHFLLTAYLFP
jgi:MFS-type transporter involved in bile tolerance (Atg22 family)